MFEDSVFARDIHKLPGSAIEYRFAGNGEGVSKREVECGLDDHSRLEASTRVIDLNANRRGASFRIGIRIDEIDSAGK
ncbi:MAG TPA: hypothetical protein VFO86_16300, partial [Terriglobia bacterium]|nr:hypothetical protein [Terriglobia bacterium]